MPAQTETQKPGRGQCGWVCIKDFGSVYSTLFLDTLKPGKLQITVRNVATVDADVDMYATADLPGNLVGEKCKNICNREKIEWRLQHRDTASRTGIFNITKLLIEYNDHLYVTNIEIDNYTLRHDYRYCYDVDVNLTREGLDKLIEYSEGDSDISFIPSDFTDDAKVTAIVR